MFVRPGDFVQYDAMYFEIVDVFEEASRICSVKMQILLTVKLWVSKQPAGKPAKDCLIQAKES